MADAVSRTFGAIGQGAQALGHGIGNVVGGIYNHLPFVPHNDAASVYDRMHQQAPWGPIVDKYSNTMPDTSTGYIGDASTGIGGGGGGDPTDIIKSRLMASRYYDDPGGIGDDSYWMG